VLQPLPRFQARHSGEGERSVPRPHRLQWEMTELMGRTAGDAILPLGKRSVPMLSCIPS